MKQLYIKSLAFLSKLTCHWISLTLILSAVFVAFNPFDMDNVTAYASRDIFYRAWGVEYPIEKSPKIAVLITREESLTDSEVWPVKYSKHYAAMNALLSYEPRAVFLDIAFFDERDDSSIASLIYIFKKYHENNIPVYIAAAESKTGAARVIRSDLQSLADDGVITLVSILQGKKYGDMVSYRIKDTGEGYTPASLKLYQDLCPDIKGRACANIPENKKELEVWWALPPSPFNCRGEYNKTQCENISSIALLRFVRLFFKGLFTSIDETDPVPTAYHPTLYWEDIMNGALRGEIDASGVLENTVIFYGMDISLINDDVFNPVYSQHKKDSYSNAREIPGVYSHAMAFDNLIVLEDKILTPAAPMNLSEQEHTFFVIVIAVILSALLHYIYLRFSRKFGDVVLRLLLLLMPIAIAITEFSLFGISPGNWIGGITVVNISHLLQKKYLTNSLKHFFKL